MQAKLAEHGQHLVAEEDPFTHHQRVRQPVALEQDLGRVLKGLLGGSHLQHARDRDPLGDQGPVCRVVKREVASDDELGELGRADVHDDVVVRRDVYARPCDWQRSRGDHFRVEERIGLKQRLPELNV